ncbi:MAG TPA: hypothetical protein VKU02_07325 [Gemmataceae bacterium]|nr:hypothetical protein [Gemmataceae bacterium]
MGVLAGAHGQAQQKAEPRVPAPVIVPQRIQLTDDLLDRLIFRQQSSAEARDRLNAQLAIRIKSIDGICQLTDAQKHKLRLAGRGDIKRFFDRYESAKLKFHAINNNQEQPVVIVPPEVGALRNAFNDPFQENSLLYKTLPNTLTSEQRSTYEAATRGRSPSWEKLKTLRK